MLPLHTRVLNSRLPRLGSKSCGRTSIPVWRDSSSSAILGFLSSIGYLARSYIGRVKRWLFGDGEADADSGTDGEAGKDVVDDAKGERC